MGGSLIPSTAKLFPSYACARTLCRASLSGLFFSFDVVSIFPPIYDVQKQGTDELNRALEDPDFRNRLFEEYDIL